MIHRRELRQLQRIILIRLAFDVLPSPGLVIWVGDLNIKFHRLAQISDPARRRADLDHHTIRGTLDEQVVQCLWRGRDRGEGVRCRIRVIFTGDALEFSEVNGENLHVGSPWWDVSFRRAVEWGVSYDPADRSPGDPAFIVSFLTDTFSDRSQRDPPDPDSHRIHRVLPHRAPASVT